MSREGINQALQAAAHALAVAQAEVSMAPSSEACPFCGSLRQRVDLMSSDEYAVECLDCLARGPFASGMLNAKHAWKTRPL